MVEQNGTLWQDSQFEVSHQSAAQQNTEAEKGPAFEFGPFVKHNNSPFLVNEVRGESFRLNPIRTAEAVSYIYDPTRPRSRKRNKNYDDEITAFSKIPQGLYTMLRTDTSLNPENIYDRIKYDFGRDGLHHVVPARAYLRWVRDLGEEVDGLSNSPFAIGIDYKILKKRFRIEGDKFDDRFLFAGRFDEVREGGKGNQMIRIRKESGRPNTFDAIRLGLDNLAYQAVRFGRDESEEQKTFLFNLVDGKRYEFIVKYSGFYVQLIDSLVYSSLAEKAGYIPQVEDSGFEIGLIDRISDQEHEEKSVYIETSSGNRNKLTAEQAHERARNCLRRMAGQMQMIDRMYDFKQINY